MNKFFSKFWVALIRSSKHWPMGFKRMLASMFAFVLWVAIPKRRHVIRTNLRLCFPDLTEAERERLAKNVYKHLARSALDHGMLWEGTKEEIQEFVTFEGLENILDNMSRPLIIVCPHFAGLDAAGIALNTYVRGVSLYQTQSNPVWDEAILAGRKRFSDPVLVAKSSESDLRPVIRAMKEGLPFFYLPDMDHGRKNSVFLPFCGVEAATIPMVSRLARVTRAQVVWCIATMTEKGYHVIVSKPFENFPTKDYVEDTRRINEELEDWIRAYPDQYLWVHRRFKTRPEGEASVY